MQNTLTIKECDQLLKELPDRVKFDLALIIKAAKEKHAGNVPVGLFWDFGMVGRALFSEGEY